MSAVNMRNAKGVVLSACDDGLLMRFVPDEGDSFAVTMDWVTVADVALRIDEFGKEALTMMQIGLDPYKASHRSQFSSAGFDAAIDEGSAG